MGNHNLAPVVGAQFAGGFSIARLANEWELTELEVEELLRVWMLRWVPLRSGGSKMPRRQEHGDADGADVPELFGEL